MWPTKKKTDTNKWSRKNYLRWEVHKNRKHYAFQYFVVVMNKMSIWRLFIGEKTLKLVTSNFSEVCPQNLSSFSDSSQHRIWRLCGTHSQHRVGLAYFELRCLRSGNVNTNLGSQFQEKILESGEERVWKKSFESKREKLRLVLYENVSKR